MADREQEMLERVATDPRRQFGWGPSIMASPEEKRAYQAFQMMPQVEAGRLPVSALPEEYGGRPTGTSRRAMRMQAAYDEAQSQALEQERIRQQMDIQQKELALRAQEQQSIIESRNLARDAAVVKAARDAKVKEQSKRFMEAVLGTTLPDGTKTKPIDIYDDNAVESIQSQMYMNDFGMEDPYVRDVAKTLLDDAMRIRESKLAQTQKQAEQQQSWLIGQQEEAASVGVDTTKFFTTKIDPETQQSVVAGVDQLGLSKAIGEAKRQDAERKKQEIASANVSEEIRKEAKDVLKGIEEIDKQIREQNFMASREKSETNRDAYLARAEYLRGERDVLTTRFQNLIPQKQTEQPQQGMTAPQQERQLSQRDQAALNWANSNPNDPRSQRIKQRLGVQ